MSDYNVKTENNEVVAVDKNGLAALFFEQYPEWAAKAIATAIINNDESDITEPINLAFERAFYKIIDLDEAVNQSGIGWFDIEDYSDEEYAYSQWLEDIEMNLDAHVATNGKGRETEFLIKNI